MSGGGVVTTEMDINMKPRFLDREIANVLGPVMRKYYMRAGANIRKVARRSLKRAPQKSLSELTERQRVTYEAWKDRYQRGETTLKPRRPDRSAKRGQPPLIHPKKGVGVKGFGSLLKERLFFALNEDLTYVVIGPELIGVNKRIKRERRGLASVEELEHWHPFMEPAFQTILPQLPSYLEKAKG